MPGVEEDWQTTLGEDRKYKIIIIIVKNNNIEMIIRVLTFPKVIDPACFTE